MSIKVGDPIPTTTFMKATPEGPQPVASDEYFRGRRVALFSVPGAFTPTCSPSICPASSKRLIS
jgi:peroxiredoxin